VARLVRPVKRVLEELVDAAHRLGSRRYRSWYFRSGDGHPSPSLERKCSIYRFERIA
jgi:hypothetical protein